MQAFLVTFRQEEESVLKYVNELQRLAGSWGFDVGLTERMLDQLVIGFGNDWK